MLMPPISCNAQAASGRRVTPFARLGPLNWIEKNVMHQIPLALVGKPLLWHALGALCAELHQEQQHPNKSILCMM